MGAAWLPAGRPRQASSHTLEAALEGGTAIGSASVSFYVARPPSSGKVVAIPAHGFALETLFHLATHYWVTEDVTFAGVFLFCRPREK